MPDARMTTIYWRDIPAQVTAKAGRVRARAALPERFQIAIDAAATRAGVIGADEYLAEWREERAAVEGDLQDAVDGEANRLESAFPPEILQAFVKNHGKTPTSRDG